MSIDIARINNTMGKMAKYLGNHESICVSVSGGADSDIIVHMIATYFREFLPKIHFVFANTGIEYKATLEHLDYLRKKYDVEIEEVRGTPIPLAVKKYGVPFVSKQVSEYASRLQKHKFSWEDLPFDILYEKYPKCKVALRWWTNNWGDKSRFNIKWNKGLKEYLIKEKPNVSFSPKCCELSKKEPLMKYQTDVKCDLYITGERKSEGGTRAGRHTSCFESSHGLDHYMPLWFWNDKTKVYYCQHEDIEHSDCYKVYGLKRTGCVGCPFGKDVFNELEIMRKHEPQCYKLCISVFGSSYNLTDKYKKFVNNYKEESKRRDQYALEE